MSVDQVDDVEAAEDLLGSFAAAVREQLNPKSGGWDQRELVEARQRRVDLVAVWAEYCRPTCGMHGTPHYSTEDGHHDPDDETCGCPCHSR